MRFALVGLKLGHAVVGDGTLFVALDKHFAEVFEILVADFEYLYPGVSATTLVCLSAPPIPPRCPSKCKTLIIHGLKGGNEGEVEGTHIAQLLNLSLDLGCLADPFIIDQLQLLFVFADFTVKLVIEFVDFAITPIKFELRSGELVLQLVQLLYRGGQPGLHVYPNH